jgi:hypothetical protein
MERIDLGGISWKFGPAPCSRKIGGPIRKGSGGNQAARRNRMQRKIIIVLALLCLVLLGVLGFVLLRGQPGPPRIPVDEAQGNASEPYHQEMDCIDRLLRQRDLNANDVEPALARCQGSSPAQNHVLAQ